jgi:hypothetical protein
MNALIGLGNIVWHSVSVGIFSALVGILLIILMPIILGILLLSLNVLYYITRKVLYYITGDNLQYSHLPLLAFYVTIVSWIIAIPVGLANGALWAVVTCIFSFLSVESVLLYQLTIIMLGMILGAKLGADIMYNRISPDDKMLGAGRKSMALDIF